MSRLVAKELQKPEHMLFAIGQEEEDTLSTICTNLHLLKVIIWAIKSRRLS
jgi:hypothetical protein